MSRIVKEENTKICKYCGNVVNHDDLFCDNCGSSLKEDEPIVIKEEKANETHYNENRNVSNNKSSLNVLACVLGAILLIVVGAGGMFVYTTYFKDNKQVGVYSNDGTNRNVSIIDNGIADAVSKVYDSVVVVENFKKGSLVSTGTGFVYKKDNKYGYILTNNHVIDGTDEVYVTFTNGKREKVSIVGTDVYSDVALLKVNVSSIISVAIMGDSEAIRLGDTSFAIGAPLDYQVYSWSVTRGIVSGKNRLVEVSLSNSGTSDYVMEVLQTDTAINSGNSGGPLCNGNGEVIGITNLKLASSSIEGMGFAIPIEKAVEYAEMFIAGKTITRPYLGISMYDLSSIQNSFYHYSIDTDLDDGVYINSVEKNSSASGAGLQQGDIITKIDNVEIKSSAYLRYILYQHKVGDKIKVTYYRDNKERSTTVTLQASNKTL